MSCVYNGNCCHDFNDYCYYDTTTPETTTAVETYTAYSSCRGNCGRYLSTCSCSMSCVYNGNCCHDFNDYCYYDTTTPETTTAVETYTAYSSCRGNCGRYLSTCSCSMSCVYNGNCCHDFNDYCYYDTTTPETTTAVETYTAYSSCRGNCGRYLSTCSCSMSCVYNGNCCHDFNDYCYYDTTTPYSSCRGNCGRYLSTCSCSMSCVYNGNCCHDFNDYCYYDTTTPPVGSCGGRLSGSASFTSPFYPNYYHDNANCEWQLSAPTGQRIFLSFVDLDLEHCCNCDYVRVHDGPSTASPLLSKLCYNDTLQDFHSSSSHMTVVFRSDHSVVARGFKALFSSSLPAHTGRVDCSSDNMTIVIQRSYLSSLGFSWQDLYLDDHRCRPFSNSYDVSFRFPLNMCGTSREIKGGRVMYTNNVRAAHSQSGEITRQMQYFLLHVSCHMESDTTVGNLYQAQEVANSSITGVGRFNATMHFYPSDSFSYPILHSPYVVQLNQRLYVQVQLTREDSSLDLFLENCVASPNHNFQTRNYDLLQNGCARDATVRVYTNGQHNFARFHFQAFKFLRTHAYVFLQCKVVVCADDDLYSRCRRGCLNRKKRALGSFQHTHTVTLGPITLQGQRSHFLIFHLT
ncbi:CUB and zona pellucida-like domain-containing protein 1 [Brachyhypopomus gauderio]|uniref:CUB and zona pellucida-like domain-containing protein 1 n=1 Tax=Brachyhypopomus gauderio TaxID=698409 RepID=UPI0040417509